MPAPDAFNTLPLPVVQLANGAIEAVNTAFTAQFPHAVAAGPLAACLVLFPDPNQSAWQQAEWRTTDGSEPYPVLIRRSEQAVVVLCLNALEPCVPHPAVEAIAQKHRDFVSVVSHEFRTPLTSIKGFADTLLRYGGNLNDEQRTKFITTIKEQADRLTRMVENLLTVSKLGEGTVQVECRTVPLHPMLTRVINNIQAKGSQDPLYANRSIQLHVPETSPNLTLEAWADPDKLEQVLTNIIDNAVKYAFANSTVAVAVNPQANDMLAVAVTNNGEGIGKDQLPKIFKRFSRADNPLTRQVEGTGLGLYITRNLISAMDGDITVESEPGQHTTFTVFVPAATDARQAEWHRKRETEAEVIGGDEALTL